MSYSFSSNTSIHRFIPTKDKTTKGDPIDVLSGQMVEQRVDFTLGQTIPLSFIRTWVRKKDNEHTDGLCGRYWVDNFSEYAEVSDNGQHIKIATVEGTYLRFALPLGTLQEEYYQEVIHQFQHNLKNYREISQEIVQLDEKPAYLLEYQWQTPEGIMYQCTVMQICHNLLLTFTYTANNPFTKKQRQALLEVVYSYKTTKK
ncbi:DcrB-related protein [Gallibacterium anatis]|uniref:DcrB-related protein n=1 Tax=Gallibacterium anatis TaxID=750 RepID=UPI003005F706